MEPITETEHHRHLEAVLESVKGEFPGQGVFILICRNGLGNTVFTTNMSAGITAGVLEHAAVHLRQIK